MAVAKGVNHGEEWGFYVNHKQEEKVSISLKMYITCATFDINIPNLL